MPVNGHTANPHATNGTHTTDAKLANNGVQDIWTPDIDPSKLRITLTTSPKPLQEPSELIFGQHMTDHMLVLSHDPEKGWSAPVIQPYQPLQLDPASSCFQYATNVFEGMKAYLGPDGVPRLFRPDLNMARLKRSVHRVALPPFDADALLSLIKRLVVIESRWIPRLPGYSLYIRPTVIGTRPSLGVAPSQHSLLYVILCPTGPYFKSGAEPVTLLAEYESVRSWPGGTGAYKLALNYAPCLEPAQRAAEKGYMQILWLLGEDRRITEAGAMNFFIVVQRDDGDLDVITPPLDGTILPGVTRASVLELTAAHSAAEPLPGLSPAIRLHTQERVLTIFDVQKYNEAGVLLEAFCVGTAVIVAAVGRIGHDGKDIELPKHAKGLGPVAGALSERITAIQEGRFEWRGWSVPCK